MGIYCAYSSSQSHLVFRKMSLWLDWNDAVFSRWVYGTAVRKTRNMVVAHYLSRLVLMWSSMYFCLNLKTAGLSFFYGWSLFPSEASPIPNKSCLNRPWPLMLTPPVNALILSEYLFIKEEWESNVSTQCRWTLLSSPSLDFGIFCLATAHSESVFE